MIGTLNSTGTSSSFIHATDAVHGDLGIVKKEDIIFESFKRQKESKR